MNKISKWIFHPLIFAIYPPLFLLAKNIDVTTPATAVRTLLYSILAAAMVILLCRLILRDWNKAACLTTLILVLFYAYVPIFNVIGKKTLFGFLIGRQRYLIAAWAALLLIGLYLIFKIIKDFGTVNQGLNLIGVVLIAFSLFQIIIYQIQTAHTALKTPQELGIHSIANQLQPPAKSELPDIYYILLDTYSRDDILQDHFNYDNSAFLDQLKSKGFYIPLCGKSNYARTELSMSSMLNMNYLNGFGNDLIDKPGVLKKDFAAYMVHNQVRSTLEDLGYKTAAFETKYPLMNATDAAYYFSPKMVSYDNSVSFWLGIRGVTDFEEMAIDTTPLSSIKSRIARLFESNNDAIQASIQNQLYTQFYALHTYVWNTLINDVPSIPSPKFVYAHVMSTHSVYVLDPNGNFHYYSTGDEEAFEQGYIASLQYTNKMVLQMVSNIFTKSKNPPIILILGDHGWMPTPERVYDLQAYYLPNGGEAKLYPSMTPVNLFRVIFDQYFGGKLDLLKDASFYSSDSDLVLTPVVGDRRPACNISNP
jgi:hypothetical protein